MNLPFRLKYCIGTCVSDTFGCSILTAILSIAPTQPSINPPLIQLKPDASSSSSRLSLGNFQMERQC